MILTLFFIFLAISSSLPNLQARPIKARVDGVIQDVELIKETKRLNEVWGTDEYNNLYYTDKKAFQLKDPYLKIDSFLSHEQSGLWVTKSGANVLYHWNGSQFVEQTGVKASDAFFDTSGTLWGLYKYRGKKFLHRWNGSTFEKKSDLTIQKIFPGPQNTLWAIDTKNNAHQWDGTQFVQRGTITLWNISFNARGDVWAISSPREGFAPHRWDGSKFVQLTRSQFKDIVIGPDNTLWATGSQDLNLYAWDTYRKQFLKKAGVRIDSMKFSPTGELWTVGTDFGNQYLYQWNGSALEKKSTFEVDKKNPFIFEKRGILWTVNMITKKINVWTGSQFIAIETPPDMLPDKLHIDDEGSFWVSRLTGGLYRYEFADWTRVATNMRGVELTPDNRLVATGSDENQYVWNPMTKRMVLQSEIPTDVPPQLFGMQPTPTVTLSPVTASPATASPATASPATASQPQLTQLLPPTSEELEQQKAELQRQKANLEAQIIQLQTNVTNLQNQIMAIDGKIAQM